ASAIAGRRKCSEFRSAPCRADWCADGPRCLNKLGCEMVTDENFFAWLDGELDPAEAARVGAEVAADEELARRAAQHRAMQARLTGAFNGVLDMPVPADLDAALAKPEAEVVDLAAARRSREARAWRPLPHRAASGGLGCRDGGGWRGRGLFAAPAGQSGTSRMAAGMEPNLGALGDLNMAGEGLDAAQEKQAQARGWK